MKLDFKIQKLGKGNIEIGMTVSLSLEQLRDIEKLQKFLEDCINLFIERFPN